MHVWSSRAVVPRRPGLVGPPGLPYYGVHSWWILIQTWGTLRFSDHRGLKPTDITVKGNSLAARLTRSKTTGDDKDVAFRMVHIADCCFSSSPSWLSTGWSLLNSLADFPRDFLLPAPAASNCQGCLRHELPARHWFLHATAGAHRTALRNHSFSQQVSRSFLDPALRQVVPSQQPQPYTRQR